MSLDITSVGATTKAHSWTYDWKTLATYTLGIGAKRSELPYLYENTDGGMKVYPTFAVVPAYAPIVELLGLSKCNMAMIVHGGQTVTTHRRIPPEGTLATTGTLTAIHDLKRFAQVMLETHTTCGGEPLFETRWSIIVRDAGGFGGDRPRDKPSIPTIPKGATPTWTAEQTTTPEQALLYRISGDTNPLHADPAFAEGVGFPQGPILHGLCTYGFLGRAVVEHAAEGDPTALKSLECQFRKPVWPGETLVTEGYDVGEGHFALSMRVKERDESVLSGAWAKIG